LKLIATGYGVSDFVRKS